MSERLRADQKRDVVLAGHRGDAEMARLALHASDGGIRAAALNALARCGELDEASLQIALRDPAAIVRCRAGALLTSAQLGIDESTCSAMIEVLLADPDNGVVETACFAAGELDPAPATVVTELMRIATAHPDPLCRESAVAALGSIGDPVGFEAVASGCRDVPAIRRRAVLALVAFDRPEADALLEELTTDHDWQVRQAAEELVAWDAQGAGPSGPAPESHP